MVRKASKMQAVWGDGRGCRGYEVVGVRIGEITRSTTNRRLTTNKSICNFYRRQGLTTITYSPKLDASDGVDSARISPRGKYPRQP